MFKSLLRYRKVVSFALVGGYAAQKVALPLNHLNCENVPNNIAGNVQADEPDERIKGLSEATINFKYVEEEGDDEEWEKTHMDCSFCAGFVASPCKDAFKTWSKCIDKARAVKGVDYVEGCKEYTSALMECMRDNEEWFNKEVERQKAEQDAYDEENASESGIESSKGATVVSQEGAK